MPQHRSAHLFAVMLAVTFGGHNYIFELKIIVVDQKYVPYFLTKLIFFFGNGNGNAFYRFKINMLFHRPFRLWLLQKAGLNGGSSFLLLRPSEFRGPVLSAEKLPLYR